MPGPLTNEQLKQRLELCRDFGVASYEETPEGGVKFTLGRVVEQVKVEAPVLTDAERHARQQLEMRRITVAHNPAARGKY